MEKEIIIHEKRCHILLLPGHGKGGDSYLAEWEGRLVVLKQIHHGPCSPWEGACCRALVGSPDAGKGPWRQRGICHFRSAFYEKPGFEKTQHFYFFLKAGRHFD